MQTISALEEKIEKLSKEKTDAMRQVIRLQEEFDEKENECKYLKAAMAELEDTSIGLKKSYEYTINVSVKIISEKRCTHLYCKL